MSAGPRALTPRVAVAQDGARNYYSLPVALQRADLLWRVYTDYYCRPGSPSEWLAKMTRTFNARLGQRMLERRSPELNPELVRFGHWNLARQVIGRRRFPVKEDYWEWQARVQGNWMLKNGIQQADAVMGFVRNLAPDFCRQIRASNVTMIADQMIAPAAIEAQEFALQLERFPGWHRGDQPTTLDRIAELERQTWSNVDHLTCASDYVRTGLEKCGVPAEKITVIHYAVEVGISSIERRHRTGPLHVGFVGAVGLRKGVPYFLEVAKRFDPAQARFTMVGPIQIDADVLSRQRGHVDVVGPKPRSDIMGLMNEFDVFYFPTTCEGSAIALIEAMAAGLPIVTSPNSGTIGRDGESVIVCNYDDIDGAEHHIRHLMNDPDRRLALGQAARKRYEANNLANYSHNIAALIHRLVKVRAA